VDAVLGCRAGAMIGGDASPVVLGSCPPLSAPVGDRQPCHVTLISSGSHFASRNVTSSMTSSCCSDVR
jgi:hypothetical protein